MYFDLIFDTKYGINFDRVNGPKDHKGVNLIKSL